MQNKGFTLTEFLIVLMIVSLLLTFLPIKINNKFLLKTEMIKLKHSINYFKAKSLYKKKKIRINIVGNKLYAGDEKIIFSHGFKCSTSDLAFNERGNIDKGLTIKCSCNGQQSNLIIYLGNGYCYVK